MESTVLPYRWKSVRGGADDTEIAAIAQSEDYGRQLLSHGAILFEGFGIDSVEKLEKCVTALASNKLDYRDGNSPRTKLSERVYTSTEYPPELPISLHNELSYSAAWPERLYFCCALAPETGGSTLIADSRAILRGIPDALRTKFKEKGVTYVRNLHGGTGITIGKSWQKTFETESKEQVESFCRQGGIQFEWKPDQSLRLVQTRPATTVHPKTNEEVWFNQLEQFHPSTNPPEVYEVIEELYGDTPFDMPQYACFGDGSAISESELSALRQVFAEQTVAFPWKRGDFLMIDNVLTAHGRSPFTGARKVLVAMS